MNEQALLRMLERETRERVTGSRRHSGDRRAVRRIPAPSRSERKVF